MPKVKRDYLITDPTGDWMIMDRQVCQPIGHKYNNGQDFCNPSIMESWRDNAERSQSVATRGVIGVS